MLSIILYAGNSQTRIHNYKKLQLTSTFEYNKELEKWVFPIGEEKQEKKQKTKNKKK